MRAVVCGSRSWSDPTPIRVALQFLLPDAVVVHGGAPGADSLADRIARELGLPAVQPQAVEPHPAARRRLGRAAAPLRNEAMLRSGADRVLAFRADGPSPGTDPVLRLARQPAVPTLAVLHGDAVQALAQGRIRALGHQVNLRGVMGAGIARQIRATFPVAFQAYRQAIASQSLRLGGILPVSVAPE